jgi:CrcB protein
MGYLLKNQLEDSNLKWFLITGICGGFTTFSTFSMDNYLLMQNENAFLAFGNILLSITLGLFAVWMGLFITK